jgi:crotonobetainyl-CoA:carnitine CoA-transferase CaiB-like acyl-CoA transferase
MPDLAADPHLAARGFFEDVMHREAGCWPLDRPVWRFELTPPHTRLPAPCFGEHNDYVLRDLIRLSDDEIAALERDGIVANEPKPNQDV